MGVNLDKPHLWKADVVQSVDLYNEWFMQFAPQTYRDTRVRTTADVESALRLTANLTNITPTALRANPGVLPMLRMATAPPLARDRLIGLSGVAKNLVESMEGKRDDVGTRLPPRIPPRMAPATVDAQLAQIGAIIERLADKGIFPWLDTGANPDADAVHRAATIVADRLCGSQSDPIIRNAQEQRQLQRIEEWLTARGYTKAPGGVRFAGMTPGTFAFRLNAVGELDDGTTRNIPVDAVVMPRTAAPGELPLLVEAKSAGDFTNVNKRQKEEAAKAAQLRRHYGPDVRFILFLRGYFNVGYLGYEASEGIDWVWEHRIEDFAQFGV